MWISHITSIQNSHMFVTQNNIRVQELWMSHTAQSATVLKCVWYCVTVRCSASQCVAVCYSAAQSETRTQYSTWQTSHMCVPNNKIRSEHTNVEYRMRCKAKDQFEFNLCLPNHSDKANAHKVTGATSYLKELHVYDKENNMCLYKNSFTRPQSHWCDIICIRDPYTC